MLALFCYAVRNQISGIRRLPLRLCTPGCFCLCSGRNQDEPCTHTHVLSCRSALWLFLTGNLLQFSGHLYNAPVLPGYVPDLFSLQCPLLLSACAQAKLKFPLIPSRSKKDNCLYCKSASSSRMKSSFVFPALLPSRVWQS